MKTETSLEERIKALHDELDVIIAKYVDERAAQVPGVHRGSVESSILARAGGCRCEEFKIVLARLEAERKLADEQVSTG